LRSCTTSSEGIEGLVCSCDWGGTPSIIECETEPTVCMERSEGTEEAVLNGGGNSASEPARPSPSAGEERRFAGRKSDPLAGRTTGPRGPRESGEGMRGFAPRGGDGEAAGKMLSKLPELPSESRLVAARVEPREGDEPVLLLPLPALPPLPRLLNPPPPPPPLPPSLSSRMVAFKSNPMFFARFDCGCPKVEALVTKESGEGWGGVCQWSRSSISLSWLGPDWRRAFAPLLLAMNLRSLLRRRRCWWCWCWCGCCCIEGGA
jgi:hypothetical protein